MSCYGCSGYEEEDFDKNRFYCAIREKMMDKSIKDTGCALKRG